MVESNPTIAAAVSDEDVISRVLAGDTASFEIIMRRHNQRLYRAARAILRDDLLAEDLVQEAWVRVYQHLGDFAGRASFVSWALRITVNEGLARVNFGKRFAEQRGEPNTNGGRMESFAAPVPDPEQQAAASQMRALLERLIDGLPDASRTVFMLRDVEGMSTSEVSEALGITGENVKVRLHRARAALREMLSLHAGIQRGEAFSFLGVRCDRIVDRVFERIRRL
jgi:RNA polymerase sigma-70 factor, ECF subfamily